MRNILIITGTVFITLWILAGISMIVSALPGTTQRKKTELITGKLQGISTCCAGGDIIFNLENSSNNTYYINRGLEKGLVVQTLKSELLNKEVTLSYHKRGWNIFNYENAAKHVCEVRLGNKVLYSEIIN
jgi:hypothetical protein